MNFTAKIRDYIADEMELKPLRDKYELLQLNSDLFLQSNKGAHDEYSIDVFEELLAQQKEIDRLKDVIEAMNGKNRSLKQDILTHLQLLKGGKLKLTIDNTSYLIFKEGEKINMGRSFE